MRRRRVGRLALPAVAMWVWPALSAPPASLNQAAMVHVWIELDLPALASVPRGDVAARQVLRRRIEQQQNAVMAALRGLGAQERGRVRLLRNALAVRLPRDQLDAARRLPGVHGVRPVGDVERPPPSSSG